MYNSPTATGDSEGALRGGDDGGGGVETIGAAGWRQRRQGRRDGDGVDVDRDGGGGGGDNGGGGVETEATTMATARGQRHGGGDLERVRME